MPIDRAKVDYFLEDLKTRPEKMRLYRNVGIAAGCCLVLLFVFLLTRGKPVPKPKPKNTADSKAPMTQGVRDAFEFAKILEPVLRSDPKFARVYLVPSAATPTQKFGKVLVMGEIASEEDLTALQQEVTKLGVSVPLEWQVAVSAPDPDSR